MTRGTRLSRLLHLSKFERKFFRTNILPITFGFPFGPSVVLPVNIPLPTKIVTEVLKPIEPGDAPDVKSLDAHVRRVMQKGAQRLGRPAPLPNSGLTPALGWPVFHFQTGQLAVPSNTTRPNSAYGATQLTGKMLEVGVDIASLHGQRHWQDMRIRPGAVSVQLDVVAR